MIRYGPDQLAEMSDNPFSETGGAGAREREREREREDSVISSTVEM
jgi:hypothetical protein